jgi:hypothetical protein
MSSTLTPDILKALRMIRDGAPPPPAAERLMVPSWAIQAMNDLVPGSTWRLTAAGAAVVALADELDEARLTLAAEQGRQEGAPSDRWTYDGRNWYGARSDGGVDKIERWSILCDDDTIKYTRGWMEADRLGFERERGRFDFARAAMLAADKATP